MQQICEGFLGIYCASRSVFGRGNQESRKDEKFQRNQVVLKHTREVPKRRFFGVLQTIVARATTPRQDDVHLRLFNPAFHSTSC